MTETEALSAPKPGAPHDSSYIAALWEHPDLCLALFGVQFHTPAGEQIYGQSGINEEMFPALEAAASEGLLLNRLVMTPEGPITMQYWRSYADLDRWARKMPHSRWWTWLLEHSGPDLSFYHEIYQVKAGEAIYEKGCHPVGPALFCSTQPVRAGEGRSKERQQQFADAAQPSASQ